MGTSTKCSSNIPITSLLPIDSCRVLMSRAVARLIELEGIEQFNMEGGGEYKDYYATGSRVVSFLTLYNRSLYARFVLSLRRSAWYARLRERWK